MGVQIPKAMSALGFELDTSSYKQPVEGVERGREASQKNLRRLKTRRFAVF